MWKNFKMYLVINQVPLKTSGKTNTMVKYSLFFLDQRLFCWEIIRPAGRTSREDSATASSPSRQPFCTHGLLFYSPFQRHKGKSGAPVGAPHQSPPQQRDSGSSLPPNPYTKEVYSTPSGSTSRDKMGTPVAPDKPSRPKITLKIHWKLNYFWNQSLQK